MLWGTSESGEYRCATFKQCKRRVEDYYLAHVEDYYMALDDRSKLAGLEVSVFRKEPLREPVPLNWGLPLRQAGAEVQQWPSVLVTLGAGTDTVIPVMGNLLGNTLRYDVNISGVGCRQVVAFQLVDSGRNKGCYCDGNLRRARADNPIAPGNCTGPLNDPINPQPCLEIDIMEANQYVWGSTIHVGNNAKEFKKGIGAGRGGDRKEVPLESYGPGSSLIDTSAGPIHVEISFPMRGGSLEGVRVTLSQSSRPSAEVEFWVARGSHLLPLVEEALRRGMTPGFSYWNSSARGYGWYDRRDCNLTMPIKQDPAMFMNFEILQGHIAAQTTDPVDIRFE
jgi:hypothetical protein